jgi:DNA-binding response OmpR family regulator
VKILVVDDELVSRLVVQAAVERLGHRWVAASDGEEAWRHFQDDRPDVLITDLLMPGVDGLELCRRVRAGAETGYTYIILATMLGDREDVVRGMEAGADDYFVKPVEPFDLQAKLIAAERVTALHAELGRYRAELAELARTDALTQLANRRSLEEDLRMLDARSQRTAASTASPSATSTTSRSTTTRSVIRPATRRCGRWPPGSPRRCAPATASTATAARSSCWCCRSRASRRLGRRSNASERRCSGWRSPIPPADPTAW